MKQHPRAKNEFILVTTTGGILRMMCDRVINDNIYQRILAGNSKFIYILIKNISNGNVLV